MLASILVESHLCQLKILSQCGYRIVGLLENYHAYLQILNAPAYT
jgi:hypothetical protein